MLLSIAALVSLGAGATYADKKVTICHVPPGNPANAHTISVGESAIKAHLGHGDQLGECPTGCRADASCDDGNACTSDSCAANGECAHAPVSCDDGNVCTDDFCDGGAGCFSLPAESPPEEVEVSCTDGSDNDCDGSIDSADPDCFRCGDGVLQPPEECDDGNTNPVDGCDRCFIVDISPG